MSGGHFVAIDLYLTASFERGSGTTDGVQYQAAFSDRVVLDFGAFPVAEPSPEYKESPAYPQEALGQGLEGVVYVKMWVDPTGEPRDFSVIKSSNAVFDPPALAAASVWRFKPAMYDGRPIGTWVSIPFRFAVK
jgi:protein TonB